MPTDPQPQGTLAKIVAFLRQIGVIKAGSVAWKGDASERPAEMLTDDVPDSQKMAHDHAHEHCHCHHCHCDEQACGDGCCEEEQQQA